jgi:wyosine [tRNA(Phe)-imidazoG37] synthetase (radical SAM superfamily)
MYEQMMSDIEHMISFGPVPSRRLGQSLGVNNIPPKICSYSCIYCQVGKTLHYSHNREYYYDPDTIADAVKLSVEQVEEQGKDIDFITFVPDGEPTLDINLGREIQLIRKFGKKIAVISNGSLLDHEDVRDDLYTADLVSIKIDTVSEHVWRHINRPSRHHDIVSMLAGIRKFSDSYEGTLLTETMLIKDVNDELEEISNVGTFISSLKHRKSYLSVPTRPPTLKWVKPADERTLTAAYFIFNKMAIETEYLIGYEGNEFAYTGNFEKDILSITAVHPMRKDAVETFLQRTRKGWHAVEKLVEEEKLLEIPYQNKVYYLRKLS